MIPYSYNMVDMGGIDLAEANGTVVEGLYNRLALARNACGDLILYNWKFAEIEIAPGICNTLDAGTSILINGLIQVTEQDEVTVPGINPEPPPPPLLIPIEIDENGHYDPADYNADGFSGVSVDVPITPASKYQEVEPDFFGLATAYQANNGSFYTEITKNQCLSFFRAEAGAKYVVFLPEQVSSRFRAAQWEGKSFSDFEPYLDTPGTNVEVYTGSAMITPSTELSGDGLLRRFFFTGVSGEILVGTSNVSALIKPILLKIQEE